MSRSENSPEKWDKYKLGVQATVKDAVELLDRTGGEIVLVYEGRELKGIVTDSDVRRGLLKGVTLNRSIDAIMNPDFRYASAEEPRDSVMRLMIAQQIRQMPVLNAQGEVVDLIFIKQAFQPVQPISTPVVIMAGGFGTRLRPLTETTPKPMMKVGNKPLLQILIERLRQEGFQNLLLSVYYRKEDIIRYFGNGEAFGVRIRYIEENEKLGTAGAIRLARAHLTEPFLVINGDILTKVHFHRLLRFHMKRQAQLTIVAAPYEVQIPYGVVEGEHYSVSKLTEKPHIQLLVNAGMYCMNPSLIELVPDRQYHDMTQLVDTLLERKLPISSFPIHEYWLDIGKIPDYEKANSDYDQLFPNSLP
ncbi:nucleotidyltransferase family protein [Cohnella hongkongensis]|uniref:Nucleotidyltransferase family protein n=1 Tax=Cohnella hongkongensis TaxID=178337 RepID=A0ABV9FL82_9BACL